MVSITNNKMPGLTLQQLQAMGAKPVQPQKKGLTLQELQSQMPTEEPAQVKQSFLSRLTSPGLFQANPNDSGIKAAAKTVGNVIPSAIGFAKGLNPMNTINTAK